MTTARATLALAVAIVLAAVFFDTTPLYVVGIGLLIAYVAARLWVWLATRSATVQQQPAPRTVVEGEEHPLDVLVRTALPIPAGTVTHPLAAAPVPAGQTPSTRVTVGVRPMRRGWHLIEPVTLHVRDPLRIAGDEVAAGESQRVLVLPRIEPVLAVGDALDGTEGRSRMGNGSPRGDGVGRRTVPSEMDGLRAYRPGSPASRIHWPILARTGELVERRLVGGADASPVVVLDAHDPDDPEALDRAVRAAASLCRHLAPASGCVLVLPGERVPYRIDAGLRLWPRAHARLAVVEASGRPPDHRTLTREAAVFWVSASRQTPGLASRLGGGVGYVVTPYPVDVGEPAFTVAGCTGSRIRVTRRAVGEARAA